jgi:hypothetical protein
MIIRKKLKRQRKFKNGVDRIHLNRHAILTLGSRVLHDVKIFSLTTSSSYDEGKLPEAPSFKAMTLFIPIPIGHTIISFNTAG